MIYGNLFLKKTVINGFGGMVLKIEINMEITVIMENMELLELVLMQLDGLIHLMILFGFLVGLAMQRQAPMII